MSTTYPIYIQNVFGQDSDALTPFPNENDPDGAISFNQGYTPPYQYNLTTNPEALPISRGQFNYLMNVITANIQQYQQKGLPEWIDPAQNGGVNYPYLTNAQVFYGTSIYRSLVDDNTSVPGTDDQWLNISGSVDSVQVGMAIMWPAFGAPQGYYFELDQSQKNRTTYNELFNVLCPILGGDTFVGTDTITGLDETKDIRVGCAIECADFSGGTVVLAIINSTSIQVSTNATNTSSGVDVRFLPWGAGDGSTTFTLPEGQGYYFAGAGGAGIAWAGETYKGVGASLGNEDYEMQVSDLPDHTHDGLNNSGVGGNQFVYLGASDGGSLGYGSSGSTLYGGTKTAGITDYTSQTNIPQIPPTKLVKFFIKYQ